MKIKKTIAIDDRVFNKFSELRDFYKLNSNELLNRLLDESNMLRGMLEKTRKQRLMERFIEVNRLRGIGWDEFLNEQTE